MHPKFVDQIHARLLVRYGSKWINLWAGMEPEDVKADWLQVLHGLSGEAIGYALENLPPDNPPNAAQFLAIARRLPPPAYKPPALSAPRANPGRVADEIAKLKALQASCGHRSTAWRDRISDLKAEGKATAAQLDVLQRAEQNYGPATVRQIGDFSPIPDHCLPPGMRKGVQA